MKKTIKGLAELALVPFLSFGLDSCSVFHPEGSFCKIKEYEEFVAKAHQVGRKAIYLTESENPNSFIYSSLDVKKNDSSKFEEISFEHLVNGESPLLKYANLDSLEKIYYETKEEGVNCNAYEKKE